MIILGDILLTLKFFGNAWNDILGATLAFASAGIVLFAAKYALNNFSSCKFKYKNTLNLTLSIVSVLLLIITALYVAFNFSLYVVKIMLPWQNITLPFVLIAVISIFLALNGKTVLYKLSVLALPMIIAIIIFMFSFSVQFMNVKYLLPYKPLNKDILSAFCPVFLNLLSSSIPILFLLKNQKNKPLLISFGLSFAVYIICVVNVLGIFGSELAQTLSYPYSVAVSTAAMGEIFSRLDGFFYAVAFFTALVKVGACLYSAKEIVVLIIYRAKVKKF